MKTCGLLFSGGLDSTCMAILLKREAMDVVPVYMSHRSNVGNVTRKELERAASLAVEICQRDLAIVKARPANERSDDWYTEFGNVYYSKKLPIPKARKGKRNRIMLEILIGLGRFDHVALGVLGIAGESSLIQDMLTGPMSRQDREQFRDCDQGVIEHDLGIKRGFLITPASLGIEDKIGLIRAVGKKGRNQGLLYSTTSCLMYFKRHCGICSSCRARARAFMAAWGEDRTDYRPGTIADKIRRGKAS